MNSNEVCCPLFDPNIYQDKVHIWKDKLFIVSDVKQIFHMPINLGKVVNKLFSEASRANANTKPEEYLLLSSETSSPWKSELYLTVTKEVEGMRNEKLSGKYISRVYDGGYNEIPNWLKDFNSYLEKNEKKALKFYFYYVYCPKCSKKYGHNYVVIFAKVE